MFIRISKTPNSLRISVRVVENYREGYKVKQKLLQHIGVAHSEEEIVKLKKLGKEFIATEQLKRKAATRQLTIMPPDSISEHMLKNELIKKLKIEKLNRKRELLENARPLVENEGPTLGSLVEEARIIDSIHEIFGLIFDRIEVHKILSKKKDQKILKDLVLMRIVNPCSKHKTQNKYPLPSRMTHKTTRIYRAFYIKREHRPTKILT